MAIAADATAASADVGAATSTTLAMTVGAGLTNGALFVGVAIRSASNNPVTGVTWNAGAMTAVPNPGTSSNRFLNTSWWQVVNPASSTHNIVVTYTHVAVGGAVYGMSFSGVDQSTPVDVSISANATAQAPPWTDALTTVTNNAWLLNTMYNSAPGPITPSNSETSRGTTIIGPAVLDDITGFESKGPISPAAATTNGWTDGTANANEFCLSSVGIRPAAAAAATSHNLTLLGVGA